MTIYVAIYLSLVVALLGLLLFCIATPEQPKLDHVGKTMFAIGLFVFLFCNCGGHALLGLK